MNSALSTRIRFFIKKGVDFDRVKRHGRRLQTPMFNLVFLERSGAQPRVGIIVSRRLGKAVFRNRAKRVFRELARHTRVELLCGKEFLIFPKRTVLQCRPELVREAWWAAMREAGLVREGASRFTVHHSG